MSGRVDDHSIALAREWRRLGRVATFVAVLTAPAVFLAFYDYGEWTLFWALAWTLLVVAAFRGLVDVLAHKLIPAPSLEDVVGRRRLWYWRRIYATLVRLALALALLTLAVLAVNAYRNGDTSVSGAWTTLGDIAEWVLFYLAVAAVVVLASFLLLIAPMLILGIRQIKAYEPGDAGWGVQLADVRGRPEAKEEVARLISLWQSDEAPAGGVLLLGPPGTGKTMLAKAIATSLHCPLVTLPGSGFAQTRVGMDAVAVRWTAGKARRMAAKWGGRCIVFVDEIDAVGGRRPATGTGFSPNALPSIHDHLFFGPSGALTPDGDLVLESAAWRDRIFALRAPQGGQGGGLALHHLLAVLDGVGEPPQTRQWLARGLNGFLDALYVVPQRLWRLRLRRRPPRPRREQVSFVGACNVALEQLDPALTRPGRMGRQIVLRTPTWEDRRDILDLYLGRVAHEAELDAPAKRDELARITNGYSPAMIEQVCSLAVAHARADGREACSRRDLVEAMTTVEAGSVIGQPYPEHEERATAIHEAGHAVCGHLFTQNRLSTRLSIRKRGASGGHHWVAESEDRIGHWRSEEVGDLIWGLGAMAAEHVFYAQTTTGVTGDVNAVTTRAALMVGFRAMGPTRVDLADRIEHVGDREQAEARISERFRRIGFQIMNRPAGGEASNPYATTLSDPDKRPLVAGLLGQAFVVAYNAIVQNRAATSRIADELVEHGELYGDEVGALLDGVGLRKPEIDVLDEATWPKL